MRIDLQPSAVTRSATVAMRLLNWQNVVGTTLLATCLFGLNVRSAEAQASSSDSNPTLDVGVVQRFGSETKDEMLIQPQPGDQITLKLSSPGQEQTLTTTSEVKVEVVMQPLPQPQTVERVVLSTHRSFESAEDSASKWKNQGVEVEIAQPRQWQVWAKRDTYSTSLMRRLLMQNLQSQGAKTAFIDSQTKEQEAKASLIVNGYRYQRDQVTIASTTNQMQVSFNRDDHGKRLYAGSLKLQPNAYGTYTLVNQVPLETYLRGVVPHEIGLAAPPTTIEAQAILARTYALRNLRRFAIDNYQICADTQCQVYWGLDGAAPESDRAIAATSGLVLTYQNELIDALYSSTTGGVTAPFSNVWNGPDRPYLRAVVDSVQNLWDLERNSLADEQNFRAFINRKTGFNEEGWEMFRWQEASDLSEIANDLRTYLRSQQHPLANFTQIESLEVTERSAAGRVQRLAVTTDRGVITLEKDEILRALYAPSSTLFYLEPVYETVTPPAPAAGSTPPSAPSSTTQTTTQATSQATTQASTQVNAQVSAPSPVPSPQPTRVLKGYTFVGGGFGHGVGMSQTGAYRLGELGWTHDRILSFYYPGAVLQPFTSNITLWRDPAETAEPATAVNSPLGQSLKQRFGALKRKNQK